MMAPWPITSAGTKSSSETGMIWAADYTGQYDIAALPNYTSEAAAAQDFDSCGNTDEILAYTPTSYPAAAATRLYAPTVTTKGRWCLPAAGIMTNIYNNLNAVQASIAKVGGVALPSCCMWSSSEDANYSAWVSNFNYSYGLNSNVKKYSYNSVRPVLEF